MRAIPLPSSWRASTRALATIVMAGIASACGGADTTSPGGGTDTVTPGGPVATTAVAINSLKFLPPAIVVARGATVTFTNQDGFEHNATFDDASVGASGTIIGNAAKSMTMPAAAGTYAYHCTLHAGMNGTVKVE